MKAKTNTTKISEAVIVTATGHSCCRGMAWESPFIEFTRDTGERILWHSDNVEALAHKFGFPSLLDMRERFVWFTGFIRQKGNSWRVSRMTELRDL